MTALDDDFRTNEHAIVTSHDDEVVVRHLVPGVSYMVRMTSVNQEGRRSEPSPKIYESTRLFLDDSSYN